MYITKEVRCPLCKAIPESTGITLASNPPWTGIECSSTHCQWRGYIHEGRLYHSDLKAVQFETFKATEDKLSTVDITK